MQNYHPMLLRFFLLASLVLMSHLAYPQKKKPAPPPSAPDLSLNDSVLKGMQWRLLGPFRGGRSCAVTGVPGKPNLYYFGSTGGGVWKTEDGGGSWQNISDGFFGGSIGSLAVSESDPTIIYAGGGEKTVRGNVSFGYGVWKSEDGGRSWKAAGLPLSRHIARIRIHPRNPDWVYAAVMGDLYAPGEERGVYRSLDGGKSWQRVLFANADAGAVDLILDPGNPRVMYASTWNVRRTPYSLSSGGPGSALWKSEDGGDTWQEISLRPGFAKGPLGIIGVAVSPADGQRIWAMVEAEEGGLFRSDDEGMTWERVNSERSLRQRAWYYTRVYADPQDRATVYVLNVSYHKSTDGGRSFQAYNAPHGDHHDLWIAPEDPQRMIIGDDGGAQVSFDGGENWSTYENQPTAQFYRLAADTHFPFRIYAAQQDNSTLRIAHRNEAGFLGAQDWEETAGGESAHLAPDPRNPEIVYGGSYGGYLTRLDHRTGEERAINVWPDNPMGHGAEGMKYRFQWNFPIFFSPNHPGRLYACSNRLHRTDNEGQSWETISPDLTRNDPSKLGPSGGPITKDNTSVEYYCTLFAAAESPYEPGLIWTGSDDGLLHLTRDDGKSWSRVTPPLLPEWSMINSIDIDPFVKGGAYVAATSYKSGDYRPYLFKTKDYGKTWSLIVEGIQAEHFTRVLRADPQQPGLLYAGTESGMYVSFDDGGHWQPFQLNLPQVPITDLLVRQGSLIVATQGRSLWIMDDLGPLRQVKNESSHIANREFFLFTPQDSYRTDGPSSIGSPSRFAGANRPGGVMTYFYLKESPADTLRMALVYLDSAGKEIIRFSSQDKDYQKRFREVKSGTNCWVWDMRYAGAKRFDGMVLWWSDLRGPKALPGAYRVRLVLGRDSLEQAFQILADPRSSTSAAGLRQQFDLLIRIRDQVSEAHEAIIAIRETRSDLKALLPRLKGSHEDLAQRCTRLDSAMTAIEEALYQTRNRSGQDPLNYPIRLTNKLAHLGTLSAIGDFPPTQQAEAFLAEISAEIDTLLARWRKLCETELPELNREVQARGVPFVRIPPAED
jgi:photosystem II stability/assembly factor-like uncharacterized protein